MYRRLRVPIGERGTVTDNRWALHRALGWSMDYLRSLPADAAAAIPVDDLRYPHVTWDSESERYLVRVVLSPSGDSSEEPVTVATVEHELGALDLLRSIVRLLDDDTMEVYRPGASGLLIAEREEAADVLLPPDADEDLREPRYAPLGEPARPDSAVRSGAGEEG